MRVKGQVDGPRSDIESQSEVVKVKEEGFRSQKPGKGLRSVWGSGVRRVEEVIGGRSVILMVRRFQSAEVTYRGQKSRRRWTSDLVSGQAGSEVVMVEEVM